MLEKNVNDFIPTEKRVYKNYDDFHPILYL